MLWLGLRLVGWGMDWRSPGLFTIGLLISEPELRRLQQQREFAAFVDRVRR